MQCLARGLRPVFLALAAILCWLLVYELVVVQNVGAIGNFWAPQRLLAYVAFVLAPGVTFMPISRALRIPLYDLEAIVAWSMLAFMVTFINPGSQPPLPVLLIFLVSLMMALATIFTLFSYAVGFRLLRRRSQRYDFVRARREGYLAAIFIVGCLLLSLLDVFSIVNAALFALIVLLIEIFLLSRSPSPRMVARQATE